MNSINLIGRTTADPQLKALPSGKPVCNLRIAVNNPPRDGKDQPAMFVDVVAFGALAEATAEHVGKGRQLAVSGRLNYQEWEADDGTRRSRHEVIAQRVDFLAKPANGNGEAPPPTYDYGDEPF